MKSAAGTIQSLIITLFLFVFVAPAANGDEKAETPTTAASEFIALLNDGKFKDASAQFDATMQRALPVEKLQAIWQEIIRTNGAMRLQRDGSAKKVSRHEVVDTVCQFEKTELTIRLSFDEKQRVAGFFILRATPPATTLPKGDPRSIRLETKTGTLVGTLDLPRGDGPWPMVLVIAGSGPTDRDGNSPQLKNDCLKMLGRALADHGIASVRYDKRGIGQSAAAGAKEEELRFETYTDDAVAWIEKMRGDSRFTKIAIIGHSEGALVAFLAARNAGVDAVVSLEGAGRNAATVLREQLKPKLSPDHYQKADEILAELERGRTLSDIPSNLLALFRPSVQPYFSSWIKYDPAKELAKLQVPVLIVQGTTDLQTSAEDATLLVAANKRAQLVTIKNMNHVLKHIEATELSVQLPTYADVTLPLDPKLPETVISFLETSLGSQKK